MARKNKSDNGLMRYGTHYAKGGRKNLEDRVGARHVQTVGGLQLTVAMVADGIGGHNAGEIAAQLALNIVYEQLEASPIQYPEEIPGTLRRILEYANEIVYREARVDNTKEGMGTTCTVVIIHNHRLYLAHVGDSRAYLVRNGRAIQLTRDHTWGNEMVWRGALSPEEIVNHPKADELFMSIGYDRTVKVDLGIYLQEGEPQADAIRHQGEILQANDRLLLCSDGLIKTRINAEKPFVTDDEIVRSVQRFAPDRAARELVKKALSRTTDDNVSAVVLEMPGSKRKSVWLPRLLRFVVLVLLVVTAVLAARFYFSDEIDSFVARLIAMPIGFGQSAGSPVEPTSARATPAPTVTMVATAVVVQPLGPRLEIDTGLNYLIFMKGTVVIDPDELNRLPLPYEVENVGERAEIYYPEHHLTIILAEQTSLEISAQDTENANSPIGINLLKGKILVQNDSLQKVIVFDDLDNQVAVSNALAAVIFTDNPRRFQADCLLVTVGKKPSDINGNFIGCEMTIDDETKEVKANRSRCQGDGCAGSINSFNEDMPIAYEMYEGLSPQVPTPTPTPTPTPSPTPTLRPTATPQPTLVLPPEVEPGETMDPESCPDCDQTPEPYPGDDAGDANEIPEPDPSDEEGD